MDFVDEIAQALVPFRNLGGLGRAVFDFVAAGPVVVETFVVADAFIQQRDFHLLGVAGHPPGLVGQVDRRLRGFVFLQLLDGRGLLRFGLLKAAAGLFELLIELGLIRFQVLKAVLQILLGESNILADELDLFVSSVLRVTDRSRRSVRTSTSSRRRG